MSPSLDDDGSVGIGDCFRGFFEFLRPVTSLSVPVSGFECRGWLSSRSLCEVQSLAKLCFLSRALLFDLDRRLSLVFLG